MVVSWKRTTWATSSTTGVARWRMYDLWWIQAPVDAPRPVHRKALEGKCRGFGFVDFHDQAHGPGERCVAQESFQKALNLAGTQEPPRVKLDHSAFGRIKVEATGFSSWPKG